MQTKVERTNYFAMGDLGFTIPIPTYFVSWRHFWRKLSLFWCDKHQGQRQYWSLHASRSYPNDEIFNSKSIILSSEMLQFYARVRIFKRVVSPLPSLNSGFLLCPLFVFLTIQRIGAFWPISPSQGHIYIKISLNKTRSQC